MAWSSTRSVIGLLVALSIPATSPDGSPFQERGLILARFREEIGIRMPTPTETQQLRLGPGIPVAEMWRVAFTAERPIEVFRSVLAGNSHVFVYEFDAPG